MSEQTPVPFELGERAPDHHGAIYVSGLIGGLEPFDNRPRALKVVKSDAAHVVAFAFAAGQVLKEHAAHHSVVISCLSGHLKFGYGDQLLDLRQGDLIHLPPGLRHHVEAVEESMLTVTMLVTDGA